MLFTPFILKYLSSFKYKIELNGWKKYIPPYHDKKLGCFEVTY
jgi:hypothetical protein